MLSYIDLIRNYLTYIHRVCVAVVVYRGQRMKFVLELNIIILHMAWITNWLSCPLILVFCSVNL